MIAVDGPAARRALRSWAHAGSARSRWLWAPILGSAAAAGGFAAGLADVLTRPGTRGLVIIAGSLLARGLCGWIAARLAVRSARDVTGFIRRRAVASLLARRRGDGVLGEGVAAAVDEVEALDGYFARYAPAALEARLAPPLIALAASLASPVSAGILLATLVPFAAVLAIAGGAATSASARQFEALARLSGHLLDRIRALPVILAYEAETRETARVAEAASDVGRRTLGVLRIAFVSTAALEFFSALAVALVAVYCGFSLLGLLPFQAPETLDFRRAFIALALAPEFYAPLRRLAAAYHEKQLGEAAAARLLTLVEAPPLPAGETAAPGPPPTVRFEQVVLQLGDVEIGPLSGEAPAGGLTAIVGPTGSGKSSMLAAILGLVAPSAGRIRVGDREAGPATASWSGQAPMFVPGSVLDNLKVADPGLCEDDALEVMARLGLTSALAIRPLGILTAMDERGSGFSGGERRRLALARAFLKPAALLLLDEPTADLDPGAEDRVIRAIREAAGNRTVVVATHSEALTRVADVVVRLT